MSALYETLKEAKARKNSVETTKVNVEKLQTEFTQFYEVHGYNELKYAGEVQKAFYSLLFQLSYDGHFFKYDPRDGKWYGEWITSLGPWEEVVLEDYFFFIEQ